MRHLKLIIFASELHNRASVLNTRSEMFEELRKLTDLQIDYPSSLMANASRISKYIDGGEPKGAALDNHDDCATVCFIATGGTEEIFRNYTDTLSENAVLLSDGFHNSLAAALEISSYLGRKGINYRHFNAPLDYSAEFFRNMVESLFRRDGGKASTITEPAQIPEFSKSVRHSLSKMAIGLIGGQSPWLIASDIDKEAVSKHYGVSFKEISVEEVVETFILTPSDDPKVVAVTNRMERFLAADRSRADLTEAARMYVALSRICVLYGLSALTVKCFDLIASCRTTSCLALSLLNEEGIVAGCEGDIPALWSMIYAKLAWGQPSFMCNPSSMNRDELTLDLAHCTIPLQMVHGFRLPSHFESSIGIGVAGSVPSGRFSIIKFSGRELENFYCTDGEVIMNTNIPQRCRTQLRFKFDSPESFDRFLSTDKGNHIILTAR